MISPSTNANILVDLPQFVLAPPPPGKPDSKAFFDGTTQRPRVIQKGSTGMTCLYAVMQWLRTPIGKQAKSDFTLERFREKLISKKRGALAKIEKKLHFCRLLKEKIKQEFNVTEIRKSEVKRYLEKESLSSDERDICDEFLSQNEHEDFSLFYLLSFYRGHQDIEEFFLYSAYKDTKEISSKNVEEVKSTVENLYNDIMKPVFGKDWKTLNLLDGLAALNSIFLKTCFAFFQFEPSSWNPQKKVTDLIRELKEHGPMMVQGYFGKPHYKNAPIQIKANEVVGRQVFGWPKNANQSESIEHQFHPILIVGARSDTPTQHVFFLDGLDGSDPSKPDSQKIYVMSYRKLQRDVATFLGFKFKEYSEIPQECTEFAVYGRAYKDGYI